jgi:outer membrane protein assembly factor BamB
MFREVGPRATPTIADGAVFTLGGGGVLHCLDFDTGAVRWRRDLHVDFHVPESFFGVACSPLVAAGKVFINVGAPAGAAFVALDCRTGKTAWTSANDEASYSSPVVTDAGDKQFVLFFARSGLHGVDLETGASRFFLRWRARIDASVNAAAPLVIGNRVFISASYNTGAALLRLNADGYDTLWTRTGSLDCHYNTAVYHEGHLYGVDGRQEAGAQLRCVELRTGKPVWTQPGYGCAAIILAEARLWVLGERGHLELVDATPTQFRSRGRSAVLSGVCRAHPALANGRYYARSATELVCLDLRRAK